MGFALRAAIGGFLLMISGTAPLCWALQNQPGNSTIRTTTHLVQFGMIVRDRNGAVRNLTKDDFVVKDRGKIQPINVFSVDVSGTTAQSAQPLPPNTYSDIAGYGTEKPRSVTIVLLDNLNALFGAAPEPYERTPRWLEEHALTNAKQHLMEFLRTMDPSDRIAIYGLTDRLRVLCDFTCNRDQLLAVVGKYDASAMTARGAVEPGSVHVPEMLDPDSAHLGAPIAEAGQELAGFKNQDRAQLTMEAIAAITEHVADIPGRKNLLWLTSNLPFSGEAIARVLARGNVVAYPLDARGLLPRSPVVTMEDANEDDYAMGRVGGLMGADSGPTGIGTMQEMAADTGGHAFVNTNDLTSAIRSAIEDSAVTYTLGFYLPESDVDGKFHKIAVQVKQAGLSVTAPRGYFADKDTDATESETRSAFIAAIRSPLDAAALPLVVRMERQDKAAQNSVEIVGSVGLKSVQVHQEGSFRKGTLDIYTIEQDATGKVLHQGNERLNLKLTEQQYISYLQSGILFHQVLQPQQDTKVLRVLVQDHGSARVGSVIIPFAHVK
ncbi:VWA domain-containing protein [Acidicapsa dinghuensis]|uniref:VWA domain-containing protein n=1 Tax=Acidicapsa dinghuensis TaxID=2218256 RepID=A0ABW1EKN3_9BACT|nr:VWA domain-containing protein [Acidicapsa dinghuensis]